MKKLDRENIEDILSLTPLQEGILYHYLKDPQSKNYFEQLSMEITGEIDNRHFGGAWNVVIASNEMLRAVFRWQEVEHPIQIILKEHKFLPQYFDFSTGEAGQKKKLLAELKQKDLEQGFDLKEVPFRVMLCKIDENKYEMIVSNHHILYDGWSNGIVLQEFFAAYNDLTGGKIPVKPVKKPFKEFVQWGAQYRETEKEEIYWRDYLAGVEPAAYMNTVGDMGGEVQEYRFSFIFEGERKKQLENLVKDHKITLAALLYGAWGILLQKYTGRDDVIFGTTVSGRWAKIEGIEDMVGLFINTLPLRVCSYGCGGRRLSFAQLLGELNDSLQHRQAYENTPLVKVKEYTRNNGKEELFNSIVVIENYPLDIPRLRLSSPWRIDSYSLVEATHYDLTAVFRVSGWDSIEINLVYQNTVFDEEVIRRLCAHFNHILRCILGDPHQETSKIDMLSAGEKQQILVDFNNTDADYPGSKCIHQLFADQVEMGPDRTALVGGWGSGYRNWDGKGSITYRELNKISNQMACRLRGEGVQPGTVVGIMAERSLEMMVGLFGILKAGGAYLPVDPAYPGDRVKFILADSKTKILLTTIDLSNEATGETRVVHLPEAINRLSVPAPAPVPAAGSRQPAYVIYTSGSTGRPKGVVIEHRSLVNRLNWMQGSYPIGEADVILQKTPVVFDVSVWELFWWSIQGASLCLLEPGEEKNPAAIATAIDKNKVTTIHFVPSMLSAFLDYLEEMMVMDLSSAPLAGLRQVFASGEALFPRHLERFNRLLNKVNGTRLINLYGPTEATVDVSYFNCPGYNSRQDNIETIPIGKPIDNIRLYILDQFLYLQPIGIPGELFISGVGLARGYLNKPVLTAERFIYITHPPFHLSRLYKTGDLTRWLPDGNVEFLGRIDYQVKIRGFRIEPGEIEKQLLDHKSIKEAVVTIRKDRNNENCLCGYIVSGRELPVSELKASLSQKLPGYMIPSFFVRLEQLPLTRSGKVDRSALPEPGIGRSQLNDAYVPPQSQVEKIIADTWKQVLKIERLGVHDNFFDLGGNSLYIIRLSSKLGNVLQRDVPVVALFNHPTVKAQARYFSSKKIAPLPTAGANGSGPAAQADTAGMEIAVIGMAGRFPGARDIDQFWDNLKKGEESITFFTDDQLESLGVAPGLFNNPAYVKAKGVLANMEYFDQDFFDYSTREAGLMDPQLRILHECVWEALENAGWNPGTYEGPIGLYAGSFSNSWWMRQLAHHITSHAELLAVGSLNEGDYLASRISYKLNLKGPAVTIQTACSSSLVAVDAACQALLSGRCRMALAGGVTLTFQDRAGYLYEEGMVRSPDGHCRPFDAGAKGTVGGNGVGMVVLKPLKDAAAEGDRVHAVIKGSAANNDGARKVGFTAPSVEGQVEVIRSALKSAETAPETVTYVETHGTGTALGDPVEFEALKQAFNTNKKGFCCLGAVKANIGHLDAAAGIAGLIKTILALEHRLIPPAVNFETPNPQIHLENSPFYINKNLIHWENGTHPLRAGVSSFGIGGTNAHVVLEEAPGGIGTGTGGRGQAPGYQLIPLSAGTGSALDKMTQNLAAHLKTHPGINPGDVAYTLQTGRKIFNHRRMILCADVEEAITKLSAPHNENAPTHFLPGDTEKSVVFMFPGQGSQYADMGRTLYKKEPAFREEMDRCFEILKPLMGYDIKKILYPSPVSPVSPVAKNEPDINCTEIAQPALFTFEYALARLLMKWGIMPAAMIGHSIGEYTAACLSGVFSLADALKLVALRGRLMQRMPSGAMLGVSLAEEDLKPLLNNGVELAAVNGPRLCVVSGSHEDIAAFTAKLKQQAIDFRPLHTSHAFHSGMMTPIIKEFAEQAAQIAFKPPQIPYISNLTGQWVNGKEVDAHYWSRHLGETVRFFDGVKELLKNDAPIFLEVGPGRVLSTFVKKYPYKDRPVPPAVNLVRHPKEPLPDDAYLWDKIGRSWLYGLDIDFPALYAGRKMYRVPLPTYPFERKQYPVGETVPEKEKETQTGKKKGIGDWFYIPSWKRTIPAPASSETGPHRWLVFSDDCGIGDRLVEKLASTGHDVITVKTGESFEKADHKLYVMNPRQSSDYDALFSGLRSSQETPAKIIHLWNVFLSSLSGEVPDVGFYSLIHLAQAIGKQDFWEDLQITMVSNHLQEVTGYEAVSPMKATVLGPVNVIPQEYPNISCRSIDIDWPSPLEGQEMKTVAQLLSEITSGCLDRVVAFRGNHRWVRLFEPLKLAAGTGKAIAARENGVYLITGGLGNIGLILAMHLAGRASVRLVLTGRSAFPAEEEWQNWLATHDEADDVSQKIRKLLAIKASGSTVVVFTADAADEGQMMNVVSAVEEQFGPINGIIHAASVMDKNLFVPVAGLSLELCETQFQAKIYGLRVLEKIFRHREVDFCLLMSSISSVLGGLGFAAYSAANIYMDTFVHRLNPSGTVNWMSINWDGWQAGDSDKSLPPVGKELVELAITAQEGTAAFDRILQWRRAPQVVVSTGHLQSRIDRWIKLEPTPLPTEAAGSRLEQVLLETWKEALGLENVGIHDNFFDLGATSLDIILVNRKLKALLRQNIPIDTMFEYPSINALAGYLSRDKDSETVPDEKLTQVADRLEETFRAFNVIENDRNET